MEKMEEIWTFLMEMMVFSPKEDKQQSKTLDQ